MSVATLTLQTSGIDPSPRSFAFDTFPSSIGYASFQDEHQEEELTSPGVDGKRWRTIFDQKNPIVVDRAWRSCTDHYAATVLADQMIGAKGRHGLLTITSGGTRTVRLHVHITAVKPVVSPGIITGPGITTGAAAVVSSWVFEVIEDF